MRALRFTRWSPRALYAAAAGRWRDQAWAGGPGSPLRLVDVAPPVLPGADWVRIHVDLGGICGSDLKILRVTGMEPVLSALTDWRAPVVPGHEIVGRVIQAGPAAGIAEGTRVVAEPLLGCQEKGFEPCAACRAGREGRCERVAESGTLAATQGFGFNARFGGGWAEQVLAPARRCVAVPDGLDDEVAVLAEPLAIGVHAVGLVTPRPGARALVFGAGTIGLSTLLALRALAPQTSVTVAALGTSADDRCRDLGAAAVVHGSRARLLEQARDVTGGVLRRALAGPPVLDQGGFDVVYDCVGSGQTIDDALRMLRPGGDLVLVATAGRRRMDWSLVWLRELRVTGSVYYCGEPGGRRELATATDILADRRPRLVTHRFGLDAATDALRTAAAGPAAGAVKVVFTPS